MLFHRASRLVTSAAEKTTGNALGDRGLAASLERRYGSKPLRQRRMLIGCLDGAGCSIPTSFAGWFSPHALAMLVKARE